MNKKTYQRRYPFTQIYNFRDIGGYSTNHGQVSAYHTIFRSGSLAEATVEDVEILHQLGIKTIIDLRSPVEQQNQPDVTSNNPRFQQISLPVNGHGRIPLDAEDVIESYLEMIENPTSAAEIFRTIITSEKPLVMHCTAGKDRTGVYIAILLQLIGVEDDDIIADYLLSFAYLRKLAQQTIKNHPDFPQAVLTPNPNNMGGFLERFKKMHATPEQFLLSIGLSLTEINHLKKILIAE